MAFSFFGLKKKPVVHNVEPQTATPVDKSSSLTFNDALAAQVAAQALAGQAQALAAQVAAQPMAAQTEPLAQAPMTPSAVVSKPPAAPIEATPATKTSATETTATEISASPEAPAFADRAAPQEAEVLSQMGTVKATREDVIAAYKIFLGRLPESMEVVDQRVGVSCAALLVDFLASKEFLDQPTKAQLMLAVAKKILDDRQLATTATSSQSQPDAPSA